MISPAQSKRLFTVFNAVLFMMAMKNNPDFETAYSHLKDMEGYELQGYIPTDDSGVTIATGVDLGQQTEAGLLNLGVPAGVVAKLKPYLGYKTRAEVERAGLNPKNLILTDAEARSLDIPFVMDHLRAVKPYISRMSLKGEAVLVSLRHWAGRLGNTQYDGKLAMMKDGHVVNYVWNTIQDKTANDEQLNLALVSTLALHIPHTSAFNRISREINYLSTAVM